MKSPSSGYAWAGLRVVLTGTLLAQAIPLIGSLVIARLFVPAEFGVFATWLGLVSLASVVITGRYETALAVEPDGDPRRHGVIATLTLVLVNGGIVAIFCGVLVLFDPVWMKQIDPMLVLLFAPTSILMAAMQTWQQWAAGDGRYRELAAIRIVQAVGVTGLQIGAGLVVPTGLSLGLSNMAGIGFGIAYAAICMPLGTHPGGAAILEFLQRQRRFPTFSLPADAINTAAGQLPLIVVGARFGAEVAGYLALTMRTLGAPISLLGAAVLDVFRRSAATAYRERGECRREYLQTMMMLVLISISTTVVILQFGEALFVMVFGETWRHAGVIAVWLMPMFALRFVASPLSYMVYVAGKQHVDLIWQIGLLGMTIVTLMILPSYQLALKGYSAGYCGMYLIYLGLSYRFSGGRVK